MEIQKVEIIETRKNASDSIKTDIHIFESEEQLKEILAKYPNLKEDYLVNIYSTNNWVRINKVLNYQEC